MNKWYQNLSVGDKVIYRSRSSSRLEEVVRFTNTQVVLSNGVKFRKSDGYVVGQDVWSCSSVDEATPERILTIEERVKKEKALEVIRNISYNKFTGDELLLICDFINNIRKEKVE